MMVAFRSFVIAVAGVAAAVLWDFSRQRRRKAPQVEKFVLKNDNGIEVHVISVGAVIQKLMIPDKNGQLGDVVLGFDAAGPYADGTSPYFGAVVGRVANRIANATIKVAGRTLQLTANEGQHMLHGGARGWDKVLWKGQRVYHPDGPAVQLVYTSPDGDEGFPGEVTAKVTYILATPQGDAVAELKVIMEARTSDPTPVSMAQHSYFNLAGHESGDVLDHEVHLPNGLHYTPVDASSIPTGTIEPVAGTPFDFTRPGCRIRDRLCQVPGIGYDHNYVLFELGEGAAAACSALHGMAFSDPRHAATVTDHSSGRVLSVSTTAPGLQLYTGNYLDGTVRGKGGAVYRKHQGLCLETQNFPSAATIATFPSPLILPGQHYQHITNFRFSTLR